MAKASEVSFHDGAAPCSLILLPEGVSVSVGRRAVGTATGSVTVGEQAVSLISPPHPESTITLLMFYPSFAMATSHDSAE